MASSSCGIFFAAKSALGTAIAGRFGYEQVDVDNTKSGLFGPNIRDEQLSRSDWERIHDQRYDLIHEHLRAGKSVVGGSGIFRRSERQTVRNLAGPSGHSTLTIFVDTPVDIARQRLLANRDSPTQLDVTDDNFKHILHAWEPLSPEEHAMAFHYSHDTGVWIDAHASLLALSLLAP